MGRLQTLCFLSFLVFVGSVHCGRDRRVKDAPKSKGDVLAQARNGKLFSLFSVVTFRNNPCTAASSTSGTTQMGTCYSESECASKGGSVDGNCASGFGVCCTFVVSGCDVTVNQNCTYVTNEGYPTAYSTASQTCTTTLKRPSSATSDICQIRLDFDTGALQHAAGSCSGAGDSLTVTSPTFASSTAAYPTPVCGTITGQHMYFDIGTSGDAQMVIATGTSTSGRTWRIKVNYIECSSSSRAPSGCTQYFTGMAGSVKSYNFDDTQVLASQNYKACVRQEAGYCSIQWSVSTTTSPDPFLLDPTVDAAGQGKQACTTNLLNIPGAGVGNFCGTYLTYMAAGTQTVNANQITSQTPFELTLITNTVTAAETGYNLDYTQLPC